jgi:chemotaxis protein CheD
MSTRERQTLVERMAQARARTVAARGERGVRPLPPLQPAAAPQGSYWQLGARPGEEVFLMPGQLHFSEIAASAKTLLGSCVALTLWHPERKIGGMCHYLLPSRSRSGHEPLDGRYGDEAMDVLLQHIRASRTEPAEYHAHLYGGADTMPEGSGLKFNVGERNIEQGWSFIDRHGFQLQGVDVGEDVPRTVRLNLATGEVEMKRGAGRASTTTLLPLMRRKG